MRLRARHARRGGFSLLEVMLAAGLLGVIVVKGLLLLDMANQAQSVSTSEMEVEAQAQRVLDRITFAILGSSREMLFPDPETPIDSPEMRYQISLGVDEDGEIAWSDPERIGVEEGQTRNSLVHEVNPDTPEVVRTAWCNLVRPFLGGEVGNGDDDNGNGLVDEKGLSFTLEGDQVTVRLTLERQQPKGPPLLKTVETTVTVRN